ncbi:MAG: nuclease-related domain-containing protein [Microbacteriaceae bacterium]
MSTRKGSGTNPSAPSDVALAAHFAGQNAVKELMAAQDALSPRSGLRRIFGVSPLTPETRVLYDRAVADAAVGATLDGLSSEWLSVHAVPVSPECATLDHVIVGPGGVFVVDTQSHRGHAVIASQRTFMVSGIRYPYIRNMEYEMGRVERLLGTASKGAVEVSGILAVVEPKSLTVRQKHRDVAVVLSTDLVAWLSEQREVLSAADIARIGVAAHNPATWSDEYDTSVDIPAMRQRFEEFHASVRTAWRWQVMWVSVATVVGAGGFLLLTWTIMANALAAFSS